MQIKLPILAVSKLNSYNLTCASFPFSRFWLMNADCNYKQWGREKVVRKWCWWRHSPRRVWWKSKACTYPRRWSETTGKRKNDLTQVSSWQSNNHLNLSRGHLMLMVLTPSTIEDMRIWYDIDVTYSILLENQIWIEIW